MESKKELRAQVQAAVALLKGPKGLVANVTSRAQDLPEHLVKTLPSDTDAVLRGVSHAVQQVESMLGTLDAVKAPELPRFKSEITALTLAMDAAATAAREHLEALEYVLSEDRKAAKSGRNHDRHLRVKVQNALVKGGWATHLAKRVAGAMASKCDLGTSDVVLLNPLSLQADRFCHWEPGGPRHCAGVSLAPPAPTNASVARPRPPFRSRVTGRPPARTQPSRPDRPTALFGRPHHCGTHASLLASPARRASETGCLATVAGSRRPCVR
jgi:hypothetical protein